MAMRLCGLRTKAKIPFIFHPTSKVKIHDPQEIANAFSDYYKSLYNLKNYTTTPRPNPINIKEFLSQINLPTLSTSQLEALIAPFTLQEVIQNIDSLPNHKSPGPDGLPREFYKQFKDTLAPFLCNLLNEAASSSFPQEMLKALVVALPKPGKEPTKPQNFRPISLLNAKRIASRLMNIIPYLIDPQASY